ncbi:hypothetical protein, partial [Phocaeicola vulgatus]|uniref:hypothetical protein n=1 Tax=Phocaeicola vulgatus TaxID=821 RepID=UPI000FF15916
KKDAEELSCGFEVKDHYYSQCRLKNSSWQVFWQDSASEQDAMPCVFIQFICSERLVTCVP